MANKLYTEEKVKKIAKLYSQELYVLEAAINTETPIELPSDEEIYRMDLGSGMHEFYESGFREGAIWLKDKILNQNNEND